MRLSINIMAKSEKSAAKIKIVFTILLQRPKSVRASNNSNLVINF
jgi:hypothetical protein